MSIYPIFIDSNTSGAQLSIGTVNSSYIVIGAPTTSVKNTSTVINGVRLDSNKNSSNLIITHANSAITPINGTDNTVLSDGLALNTGSYNTAVGSGTLLSNTLASNNTAVGYNALKLNTGIAGANTAIGSRALESNVTGSWNVAVGRAALASSNDHSNVALGADAFPNISGNSIYNVGVGTRTCPFYTSGSNNTMIGYATNDNNSYTSGTGNTCIGYATNTSNYSYSTALGYGATCTASNQIMIGTTAQTTQIGNSRITNSGNTGALYLSTNSINNNTGSYIADYLLTAQDTWDSSVTAGSTIYGRTIGIVAGNTSFNATNGYRNATAHAGDIVIRGGSSKSPSDGTHAQTLRAGNVYIDGGSAWCNGGSGNSLTAVQGSIFFRTGKASSGNTYYNDQVNLMSITPTNIRTNVSMTIYEEIGSGDSSNNRTGSLVIDHGDRGGVSSIIFPSRTNGDAGLDRGYIRYRDDVNNTTGGEQNRLEIGVENDLGPAGSSNDCLILNKSGGCVGIGQSNPLYTLDVTGDARISNTIKCNIYDTNNTTAELQIGPSVTGGVPAVIRIGENITNGIVAIGNGSGQNGTITIGGSGNLTRTITIGSQEAMDVSPINLNGNVALKRPLTLSYTTLPTLTSSNIGYTAYRYFPGLDPNSIVNDTEYLSYSINLPAGVYLGQFVFIPSYARSGYTIFSGFYWTVKSTTGQSINSTYYSGTHNMPTMSFGNGGTYPSINLGSVTFSLSATVSVQAAFKAFFTHDSYAASMYSNTESGTAGSKFTITRIG